VTVRCQRRQWDERRIDDEVPNWHDVIVKAGIKPV